MLYCLLWNEAVPLPPQEKTIDTRIKYQKGNLNDAKNILIWHLWPFSFQTIFKNGAVYVESFCILKSSELLVKTYYTTFPFLFAVPPWLTRITERINEKSGLFPSSINHVLINEYLPNQGIMVCSEHKQAALLISFAAYSSFFLFPHFLLLSQVCVHKFISLVL